MPQSSPIAEGQGHTSEAAGFWIRFLRKSDAMTEQEWLTCMNPVPMLEYLHLRAQDKERKRRLFAVACCRKVWQIFPDEPCRRAVECAERFADGNASEGELAASREAAAYAPISGLAVFSAAQAALTVSAREATYSGWDFATAEFAFFAAAYASVDADSDAASNEQALILRDIFGNPFRKMPAVETAWLAWKSGTIPKLAQAIYDERAFDRMPILADTLQEAGWTDADILSHCGQPGPHVRGCWVLDLVLGKE